jgi:uncharacterized surface protein with fasciclin (FAS1) repeats
MRLTVRSGSLATTFALALSGCAGTGASPGTIVDVASGAGRVGTLSSAIDAAGLAATLRGPGPYTLFAPTDEAFAQLPAGVAEELLRPENRSRLTDILTYHVVPGEIPTAEVSGAVRPLKTLNGAPLDITRIVDRVYVDYDAEIVRPDLRADNGVVHLVDDVLLPPEQVVVAPASVAVGRTIGAVAVVEAIDPPRRLLTLRGEDGEVVTVRVGEDVRNLERIRVGDRVVARYREAVAVGIKPPDRPPVVPAEVTTATARAPVGDMPASLVAGNVTATVQVERVDPATGTVWFRGPSGVLRVRTVEDPELRRFVGTLEPGDEVDVSYTEAVAVSVEPAAPR